MYAAVVDAFDTPPTYREVPEPVSTSGDEVLVDVVATGLHPRVRSQADGSHYTSTHALPLVPGIDGVGRTADGTLRYFVLPDTTLGSMAQRTLIDPRRSVVLPDDPNSSLDTDAVRVAAAANPVMGSWIALRRRIDFPAGRRVLVLGATGSAGRMAVQVTRHLGASYVVAAGRRAERLARVAEHADRTVSLDGPADEVSHLLGEAAGGVDVVLDFVWGQPAADAMVALVTARSARAHPLTWVQIGSVAGPAAAISSAALRASRLQIVGSGQGSVPARDILAELPAMLAEIARGTFSVETREVPLAEVSRAWADTGSDARVVIRP